MKNQDARPDSKVSVTERVQRIRKAILTSREGALGTIPKKYFESKSINDPDSMLAFNNFGGDFRKGGKEK